MSPTPPAPCPTETPTPSPPGPTVAPPTRVVAPPTAADLAAARAVVAAHLAPTPLVAATLPGVEGEVLLKLECLQPTGSFKVRGALAALAALSGGGPDGGRDGAAGVVTASAGNHGLGLAYAAGRLGVPATVVVPTTASPAKAEALRRTAAELVEHGDDYEEAERHALALAERGPTFVSAYNDTHVMAGQATLVDEVAAQAEGELTLVVPVGGGGLVAGVALRAADRPGTRVVGVEAAHSQAVSAAVAAGRHVTVPVAPSLADGLGGNLEPGSITPAVAAGHVHGFVAVSEDQIAAGIRTLATRVGIVAEGAGAVGVAALAAGLVSVAGRPVVVVTGRNIAPALLADVLTRG